MSWADMITMVEFKDYADPVPDPLQRMLGRVYGKTKPVYLQELTPAPPTEESKYKVPAERKYQDLKLNELIQLQKKNPAGFKEYVEERSGTTTAHLTAGQDTLVVVEKMLQEKGFMDWEAVPANDFTLQVDLDMERDAALAHMEPILPLLCRRVPLGLKYAVYTSKGGKTHAVFTMPEAMELYERMAWQTVLGSDRVREALNLIGLKNGVVNQVVLFQPKDKSQIVFEDLKLNQRRIKEDV